MISVLSYGGGVQTFAILILIEKGIIEKPDFIIFADTLAEYPETYFHIENVAKPLALKLGIEWMTVQEKKGLIEGYSKTNSIPLAGFRNCTSKYKRDPIQRKLREILGSKKKKGVPSIIQLIGISNDEAKRAVEREEQKPKWSLTKYPLLEKNYSRKDLLKIIEESGYPIPRKSGCFICPYGGMKAFVKLKKTHPDLFKIAFSMEEDYLKNTHKRKSGFVKGLKLADLNAMPSIFDFDENLIINDQRECDSGGCFL